MQTVKVNIPHKSYLVHIGCGLLKQIGEFIHTFSPTSTVIISDSTVADLYTGQVKQNISNYINDIFPAEFLPLSTLQFPAGEANKNLQTFSKIFDELFELKPAIDRSAMIVGLGGGVSTDIAGFIAATALRGMRWISCPTTLLGAVDASVGGKTGIDHQAGKNLIGAFHHPSVVVVDIDTLKTLPTEEIQNGLAECIKHAIIENHTMLDYIENNAQKLIGDYNSVFPADILAELVTQNIEIKARIVSQDANEKSIRAHLNLGHTIGHALEKIANYDSLKHGQAVALGTICACKISVDRGLINAQFAEKICNLFKKLGLFTKLSNQELDFQQIWTIMQHDKKNLAGKVRMILPTNTGVQIFDDIQKSEVRKALQEIKID